MATMEESKWWDFYMDQIRYCETKDIEGIRSHYTPDAALLALDYQYYTADGIAEHFKHYLNEMVKGLKLKSTDKYLGTDDSIFLEATVTMEAGEAKVYDVFYMKDGLIHRHYTGLISFTPKS